MSRQGLIMNYKEYGVKKKQQRSKLRTMRVAKKLYLKNGRLILGSRKKPYIKSGRFILGNEKTQRGGFLRSILATLAPAAIN